MSTMYMISCYVEKPCLGGMFMETKIWDIFRKLKFLSQSLSYHVVKYYFSFWSSEYTVSVNSVLKLFDLLSAPLDLLIDPLDSLHNVD